MAQFDIAYKHTMSAEGGYVNDSNDIGGETYKGVSRKYHPAWSGWSIIDKEKSERKLKRGDIIINSLLDSLVFHFYEEEFWSVNRLGKVKNQAIANELFDTGVNMHPKFAAGFVQRALNLLNRNEKDYEDIAEDGVLGNITLRMINKYPYQKALLKTLNGLQFMRYVKICEYNPSQENNFRGWLKRV